VKTLVYYLGVVQIICILLLLLTTGCSPWWEELIRNPNEPQANQNNSEPKNASPPKKPDVFYKKISIKDITYYNEKKDSRSTKRHSGFGRYKVYLNSWPKGLDSDLTGNIVYLYPKEPISGHKVFITIVKPGSYVVIEALDEFRNMVMEGTVLYFQELVIHNKKHRPITTDPGLH